MPTSITPPGLSIGLDTERVAGGSVERAKTGARPAESVDDLDGRSRSVVDAGLTALRARIEAGEQAVAAVEQEIRDELTALDGLLVHLDEQARLLGRS